MLAIRTGKQEVVNREDRQLKVCVFSTLILIMADGVEINEHIPQCLICPAFKCKITKAFTKLTDH